VSVQTTYPPLSLFTETQPGHSNKGHNSELLQSEVASNSGTTSRFNNNCPVTPPYSPLPNSVPCYPNYSVSLALNTAHKSSPDLSSRKDDVSGLSVVDTTTTNSHQIIERKATTTTRQRTRSFLFRARSENHLLSSTSPRSTFPSPSVYDANSLASQLTSNKLMDASIISDLNNNFNRSYHPAYNSGADTNNNSNGNNNNNDGKNSSHTRHLTVPKKQSNGSTPQRPILSRTHSDGHCRTHYLSQPHPLASSSELDPTNHQPSSPTTTDPRFNSHVTQQTNIEQVGLFDLSMSCSPNNQLGPQQQPTDLNASISDLGFKQPTAIPPDSNRNYQSVTKQQTSTKPTADALLDTPTVSYVPISPSASLLALSDNCLLSTSYELQQKTNTTSTSDPFLRNTLSTPVTTPLALGGVLQPVRAQPTSPRPVSYTTDLLQPEIVPITNSLPQPIPTRRSTCDTPHNITNKVARSASLVDLSSTTTSTSLPIAFLRRQHLQQHPTMPLSTTPTTTQSLTLSVDQHQIVTNTNVIHYQSTTDATQTQLTQHHSLDKGTLSKQDDQHPDQYNPILQEFVQRRQTERQGHRQLQQQQQQEQQHQPTIIILDEKIQNQLQQNFHQIQHLQKQNILQQQLLEHQQHQLRVQQRILDEQKHMQSQNPQRQLEKQPHSTHKPHSRQKEHHKAPQKQQQEQHKQHSESKSVSYKKGSSSPIGGFWCFAKNNVNHMFFQNETKHHTTQAVSQQILHWEKTVLANSPEPDRRKMPTKHPQNLYEIHKEEVKQKKNEAEIEKSIKQRFDPKILHMLSQGSSTTRFNSRQVSTSCRCSSPISGPIEDNEG